MKRKLQFFEVILLCAVWVGLTLLCWFSPAKELSVSERRPLAQLPQYNAETVNNGSFMSDFETYTLDQFPWRDGFRRIKALSAYKLFAQKDNNDIYIADGQAAKLEADINEASLQNALAKIQELYDSHIASTGADVYFSIVPDKGYYLAEENGYLSMDYAALKDFFITKLEFAKYIDIFDTLQAEKYYATDSHWKQELITDTAEKLAAAMGQNLTAEYETFTANIPFYGVYYGQAALPMKPDTIHYLSNEMLDNCTVFNVENGKTTGIYDMEKLQSNDPYEMFLSGAAAILQLDNPNATSEQELIVFRDSYASSLVPLLAEAYSKITLVDTRYVAPEYLHQFVDFHSADQVLFLYSTSLLNSSGTLK